MKEYNDAVNFTITGDFCPINRTEDLCKRKSFEILFKEYIDLFLSNDFNITNLECPLTTVKKPIIKMGPNLKSDKVCMDALKHAKINIVTLANNHIMDFGEDGLRDTIEVCQLKGIQTVGTGKNLDEASDFLTISIKGRKISIINFCENEFSIASNNSPGANPYSPIQNFYQIKEAKLISDIVIVIVHGGVEQYRYPTPRMKEAFRFFINSGADAVVGHHTHCIAGYEFYKGKPILYSLGNFLFDYPNRHKSWNRGVISQFILDKTNQLTFSLIPFHQYAENTLGLTKPSEEESLSILEEIRLISSKICDDKFLEKELTLFSQEKKKGFISNIFSLNRVHKKILYWFFPEKFILNEWRKKRLKNYFLCEAHKDILERIL